MGKKRKKKRKIKKNYNKKEFREVLCQHCGICKNPDPIFCYVNLYKHEPKAFVNKIFSNLLELHAIYRKRGKSVRSMSVDQFKNVVCKTGVCFNGDSEAAAICDAVKSCYREFMKQLGVKNGALIYEANKANLITFKNNTLSHKRYISYNKRKNRRKRRVFEAYPSFFTSDDAKFQEQIKKILYGNNDSQ